MGAAHVGPRLLSLNRPYPSGRQPAFSAGLVPELVQSFMPPSYDKRSRKFNSRKKKKDGTEFLWEMPAAAAAAAQGHPSGPERPAEEAPSVAGSEPAPSTSSSGPRPAKRKAIKNDKDEPLDKSAPTGATGQKRRRRVFSCQSCQRLKCRCEYDPGSQACHRCVTLRSVFIHLLIPFSSSSIQE